MKGKVRGEEEKEEERDPPASFVQNVAMTEGLKVMCKPKDRMRPGEEFIKKTKLNSRTIHYLCFSLPPTDFLKSWSGWISCNHPESLGETHDKKMMKGRLPKPPSPKP